MSTRPLEPTQGMLSYDQIVARLGPNPDPGVLEELYERGKALCGETLDQIKAIEAKATLAAGYGLGISTFLVTSASSWISKGNQVTMCIACFAAVSALTCTWNAVQATRVMRGKGFSQDYWIEEKSLGNVAHLRYARVVEFAEVWGHRFAVQRTKAKSVRRAEVWLFGAGAYLALLVLHLSALQLYLRWIPGRVNVHSSWAGRHEVLFRDGSWVGFGAVCIVGFFLLILRSRRL